METKFQTIDKERTGKRIKQLMDMHGYTARDIQRFLNLTAVQAVYHWISGRSLPSIDHLYALSELFHVTIDEMICGSKDDDKTNVIENDPMRILSFPQRMQKRIAAYISRILLCTN